MSVSKPVPGGSGSDSGPPPSPTKRIAGISIIDVIKSFAKKISTVAIVYLLGVWDFSAAWLVAPVIYAVIREEWRKEKELKRSIAKMAATSDEKDVILARVDDLPSWVFFPDVERAEWVNKIIKQVWPNINHYAKTIIKETIEPAVAASLATYKLSGFQFQKMNLGAIPPRIGGVKVYDRNVSRSEILMDLDIMYSGDCDISFTLAGISGGIKDFQIHGMMRVVMKPLINVIPMVGGLQLFFLNNPSIDFNLVGMADLLDMPGLSDLLRRIIVEQVAAMMVLPNKLPIQLSDAIQAKTLRVREPEGVLRVHVVEAKKLLKKDIGVLGKGKSDPYAIINVGAQEFRTPIKDNTVDPKWNYWCEFMVEQRGQKVHVHLLDHDKTGKDENLGRATMEVNTVAKKGEMDSWLTLEEVKHGIVHIRCTWFNLSSDVSLLKPALEGSKQLEGMSSALLNVYIDSIKNLPNARAQSKPDPYVTITLGKQEKKTITAWRTDCPVFEQGFVLLVHNPELDTMQIKVTDNKTGKDIGLLIFNLSSLLEKPNMTIEDHPLQLKNSGPETKISLTLNLKVLVAGGDHDQPSTPPPSPVNRVPNTPPAALKKPSVEQFIESEAISEAPAVKQSEPPVASENTTSGSTLKRGSSIHSVSSGKGEYKLGRILLTFTYSVQKQKFVIRIHRIENIPLPDPSNIPDPYVKIYLLPERSRDSKRRTESVKDNCNPVYEQDFEYVISKDELSNRQLELSVCTRKGMFSSQPACLGQVLVNIRELDLAAKEGTTEWFDLVPEFHKDKDD